MEQVFAHPQVRHRQMLQTVEHPQLGTLKLVRNPMVPAGSGARCRRRPCSVRRRRTSESLDIDKPRRRQG